MAICCAGDRLGPKLEGLLACAVNAFEECGLPPCRAFVTTAPKVPWDVCCECNGGVGQLWVQVDSVRSLTFSNTTGREVKCKTVQEADVKIGILRCALTQDDAGNPPEADHLTQEAMEVLQDRLIIVQAVQCCFAASNDIDDFTVRDWVGLAGGGCVGGEQEITLRFSDPKCA